jgi:Cu(I)/Ag(I) efflux system membrane fusion protein
MATVTVMETEKKDKRMSRRARTITLAALVAAAFIAGYLIRGRSEAPPVSDKQGHQAVAEVWTCSMHPQIRMPGPGKCPICFMDLIPVEQLAGEDLGDRRLAMSESAIKLAEIETSPVSRRPAAAVIRSVGSVAFDETRISEITAWVPGRIEKLLVNFTGAVVRRGDPLAEIYSPALVIAQEELVQAKRSSDAAPGDAAAAAMLDAAREKLRQYGMTARQIEAVETEGKASRTVPEDRRCPHEDSRPVEGLGDAQGVPERPAPCQAGAGGRVHLDCPSRRDLQGKGRLRRPGPRSEDDDGRSQGRRFER